MKDIKIESNIPIPVIVKYACLVNMKIGDSFLVSNTKDYFAMRAYLKRHCIKTTARKIDDNKWRIWRINEK